MPLSVDRLIDLLARKKMVPVLYLKMSGTCAFIKLLSFETGENFLLYIQSKYEIKLPKNMPNVCKIKYLDMDTDGNIIDRYADGENRDNGEDIYLDSSSKSLDGEGIENKLEGGYKNPINFSSSVKEDKVELNAIYRQLKRLGYCLDTVRYKMAVIYKKYLCTINRDGEIDFYTLQKFDKFASNKREILIHFDLELFYENQETIMQDIAQVRRGIQKNLDKNHIIHITTLNNLIKSREDVFTSVSKLLTKKNGYRGEIEKYKNLLASTNDSCRGVMSKIEELERSRNSGRMDVQSESVYFRLKTKLDRELKKSEELRKEIQDAINYLGIKESDLSLLIDKSLFDNSVMLDRIFMNLNELIAKCKDT